MTEAQKILAMIETVAPDESVALNKIDTDVHFFIYPLADDDFMCKQYTRSRDALKAIRPEGWGVVIAHHLPNGHWYAQIFDGPDTKFHGSNLPTEELAELHAIIQAIAYERGER